MERSPDSHRRGGGPFKVMCMIKRRVAVIGAGMTLFRRRLLETGRELSYEASDMALTSAGMTMKDDRLGGGRQRARRLRRGAHEGRVSARGVGRDRQAEHQGLRRRRDGRIHADRRRGGTWPRVSSTPAWPSPRRRCPLSTRIRKPPSGPSSTTRPRGRSE